MTGLTPVALAEIRNRAEAHDLPPAADSAAVRRWALFACQDRIRLLAELDRVTGTSDRVEQEIRVIGGLPPISERRALRESAGLSQARLARAVGVSRNAISQWESGARKVPRGPLLDKYVRALDALREHQADFVDMAQS
jgi:DNA-binding XRE family transcriptional regulator